MQKLLLISFSIILMYVNIGYYVQVTVQKELARHEMKERIISNIPDSLLTRLELKAIEQQITWKEDEKEFWLNDDLYDLVKSEIIAGKTYLYCINDQKEETLIQNYGKSIQKKSSSDQEQNTAVSFFPLLFINPIIPSIPNIDAYQERRYCLYNEDGLKKDKKISSPPPKG
jgi:hypothetical protein